MSDVKKRIINQAIGLTPILLFMFLDNYFSYRLSYVIAVIFCLFCVFLYQVLSKDRIYVFMLLPASATFLFYSIFIFSKLEPMLFIYSPLITEVILVVVMAVIGFSKPSVLKRIRHSKLTPYKRTMMRTTLNEFYFVVQLVQSLYTLHLFIIIFYTILPDTMQEIYIERFIFRELGILIGLSIIIYEQVRIYLMKGSLKKEMWLPVLDDNGKVIGCIARSVSRSVPKKYCHPVVRIAVLYEGKLFLTKRYHKEFVYPDLYDSPFRRYVIFRQTIDQTVKSTLGKLANNKDITPRFLIRYMHENDKVKHMVYLYVLNLRNEKQLEESKSVMGKGKFWTSSQIQENLGKGAFSGYFEEEFPYIKNTILFAENFNNQNQQKENEPEK